MRPCKPDPLQMAAPKDSSGAHASLFTAGSHPAGTFKVLPVVSADSSCPPEWSQNQPRSYHDSHFQPNTADCRLTAWASAVWAPVAGRARSREGALRLGIDTAITLEWQSPPDLCRMPVPIQTTNNSGPKSPSPSLSPSEWLHSGCKVIKIHDARYNALRVAPCSALPT